MTVSQKYNVLSHIAGMSVVHGDNTYELFTFLLWRRAVVESQRLRIHAVNTQVQRHLLKALFGRHFNKSLLTSANPQHTHRGCFTFHVHWWKPGRQLVTVIHLINKTRVRTQTFGFLVHRSEFSITERFNGLKTNLIKVKLAFTGQCRNVAWIKMTMAAPLSLITGSYQRVGFFFKFS